MLLLLSAASAAPVWPSLATPPPGLPRDLSSDAALVISIEDYDRLPDIPGARANGEAWAAYLRARGAVVRELRDGEATDDVIEDNATWVRESVKRGGAAWVVFIGHGSPSRDGSGLLVGADARPTIESIESRSLTSGRLLAALGAGGGTRLVAVIDACFSGESAAGRLTTDPLQPARPVELDAAAFPRATVLVAARNTQYAGPMEGLDRPAFSYLALAALRGWADADGDGGVTAGEVVAFANDRMLQHVRGRRQQAQLLGQDDAVLAGAVESPPPVDPGSDRVVLRPAGSTPDPVRSPSATRENTPSAGKPGAYAEVLGGYAHGDLGRQYSVRVDLDRDFSNTATATWTGRYLASGMVLRVRGGYATRSGFDLGLTAGAQWGEKSMDSGWYCESCTEQDETTEYAPVEATRLLAQPTARLTWPAASAVQAVVGVGLSAEFFDGFEVPDEGMSVDYPDAPGGIDIGPSLELGARFRLPGGPYVQVLADGTIWLTESSSLSGEATGSPEAATAGGFTLRVAGGAGFSF